MSRSALADLAKECPFWPGKGRRQQTFDRQGEASVLDEREQVASGAPIARLLMHGDGSQEALIILNAAVQQNCFMHALSDRNDLKNI
jgi:hypothetical protein